MVHNAVHVRCSTHPGKLGAFIGSSFNTSWLSGREFDLKMLGSS